MNETYPSSDLNRREIAYLVKMKMREKGVTAREIADNHYEKLGFRSENAAQGYISAIVCAKCERKNNPDKLTEKENTRLGQLLRILEVSPEDLLIKEVITKGEKTAENEKNSNGQTLKVINYEQRFDVLVSKIEKKYKRTTKEQQAIRYLDERCDCFDLALEKKDKKRQEELVSELERMLVSDIPS